MHRTNAPLPRTLGLLATPRALALAVLAAAPVTTQAAQFLRWENRREGEGGFRLIPELVLMSSSGNYGATGSAVTPAGLDYSKTLLDLNLVYGIGPKLTAFGRISLASVAFETTTLKGSGFGLGDQALGFNYRVFESVPERRAGKPKQAARRTQIDLQLQLDLPMYDKASARRSNPQNPLLGDGTFDITIGPFLTHPLNQGSGTRLFLVGGLAALFRNSGYSPGIPYQLGVTWIPESRGFFGRAGLNGLQALKSDPASAVALNTGATVKDAGDSLIVNALNSSYTAAKLTGGFQFTPTSQLALGYQKTLRGKSTANLSAITIGAQFRFGGATRQVTGKVSGRRGLKYDFEGMVTQTNERLHLAKIDKGTSDGVAKGQTWDLYRPGPDGRPVELIARGTITDLRSGEAVIRIRQFAKQVVIQNGFIAQRLVR